MSDDWLRAVYAPVSVAERAVPVHPNVPRSASGTHFRRGSADYSWRGSEAGVVVEVWWPL